MDKVLNSGNFEICKSDTSVISAPSIINSWSRKRRECGTGTPGRKWPVGQLVISSIALWRRFLEGTKFLYKISSFSSIRVFLVMDEIVFRKSNSEFRNLKISKLSVLIKPIEQWTF